MNGQGLITSIESYTVHDGPGCRTTVFMAGCPLQCEWCANPETWDLRQKILYAEQKCQIGSGCTRCITACPRNAITQVESRLILDGDKCRRCNDFRCADICYTEALRVCGTWYTEAQLMKRIDLDRDFWGDDGGVTFSGGEPLVQYAFLKRILERCKERYIHTAIETTAYAQTGLFLDIVSLLDFVFIDIKHMDSLRHKEKTGVPNTHILQNIELLVGSGWPGRLILRMPVIEGYNDSPENTFATAVFMKRVGLKEINILPFHRLGDSKWRQLGKTYRYHAFQSTGEEKMHELQNIFANEGLICYTGSNTAF